ncbi:MAG: HNH endonuclease signature motif containing protein, partial [Bdellovibrionota bacterium]
KALQAKLERLMALMSRDGAVTLTEVVERMADIALTKLDPIERAGRAEKRAAKKLAATQPALGKVTQPATEMITRHSPSKINQPALGKVPTPIQRSRYIHATVRHAVYMRDGGLCVNCGSSSRVEVDHVIPFALGGESDLENLRLLCRSCNQRHAVVTYGQTTMGSYLREPAHIFH